MAEVKILYTKTIKLGFDKHRCLRGKLNYIISLWETFGK
jgi:hypothetical protein